MDYEKKYKEALERAKKEWVNNLDGAYNNYRERLEIIFPELAEPEDEKIRKSILIYLDWLDGRKDYAPRGEYTIRDMISWLEKQGEKKPQRMISAETKEAMYDKPANKVEPKFHEGDWVIGRATDNDPNQIAEITEEGYKTTYGGWIGFSFEEDMRLWTIQDAKDGDVLVFKNNIGGIIICKSPTDYDTGSYCRLVSDNLINKEESGWDSTLLVPATKEQRDLLFQKMKEAGYEWDAEKKKLKKIEQKPAWSEEDNMMIEETLYFLREYQQSNRCKDENGMQNSVSCEKWLKSLKQRITD